MKDLSEIEKAIFEIDSCESFNELALEIFRFQSVKCQPFAEYIDLLGVRREDVSRVDQIPFLPIELFKSHRIYGSDTEPEISFSSSGTTGSITSKHHLAKLDLYEDSFIRGFEMFYGPIEHFRILALLPSYLERTGSSLVYMADRMIEMSIHPDSGFFLNDYSRLSSILKQDDKSTLLIGVSFALLDLVELESFKLNNTIVMETGGMKGRKKEITRQELHQQLKAGFGVSEIHSEYGMTELLSQAYSKGGGKFQTPPWMRLITRDVNDPLSPAKENQTGGLNVIDLANLYSCSFIATSDLGRIYQDGSAEILGRFDFSETRGCNLMVAAP